MTGPQIKPTTGFLASIVKYSDDAIITNDFNGRVTSWKNSAERMFHEDGPSRIAVADNAIGIDSQHHKKIFRVFKRLHGDWISGTGIGLVICQRIVERYGGRIWVEPPGGEGATSYFTRESAAGVSAHV